MGELRVRLAHTLCPYLDFPLDSSRYGGLDAMGSMLHEEAFTNTTRENNFGHSTILTVAGDHDKKLDVLWRQLHGSSFTMRMLVLRTFCGICRVQLLHKPAMTGHNRRLCS